MKRSVVFIGSRGIPGKYGGTETFVEELSRILIQKGFRVYVTCESDKFLEDIHEGIIRVHIKSIQGESLTIPSLNDLIATFRILKLYPEDISVFYYVAPDGALASVFPKLMRKKVLINPDGVEWRRLIKRSQFVSPLLIPLYLATMIYMYLMENLSCRISDIVIADSFGIKEHLTRLHKPKKVVYIPYGARKLLHSRISPEEEQEILNNYNLRPLNYYLTVARIVAENNIHVEIEGFKLSGSKKKLVIVGNFNRKDPYTKYLFKLRGNSRNVVFLDPIYDREILGVLRKNCFAYIHAYEVGGTNPSLLEQMLFKRPILAYDVPFHREVLEGGGIYFKTPEDLAEKIRHLELGNFNLKSIRKIYIQKIKRRYSWSNIEKMYEHIFKKLLKEG